MGYEGIAAKAYFNRIFGDFDWHGRRPRIKRDSINLLLDIGYTVLFNYIDALCNLYGFDTYKGNLHQQFFKRKSLVCDLVEPFRPIIDSATRKSINLKQITKDDFTKSKDGRYSLEWKQSAKIVGLYVTEISRHKQSLFRFIQSYYRWFMKNAYEIKSEMPKGEIKENDFDKL
jgi:CRISPR-associated protein Cas1